MTPPLAGALGLTGASLKASGGARPLSPRFGKGSLIVADDLVVILSDRGTLALAEADPSGYTELGRVQAMEGKAWTNPTLAGGTLYLRDHDELVAFDLTAAAAASPGAE